MIKGLRSQRQIKIHKTMIMSFVVFFLLVLFTQASRSTIIHLTIDKKDDMNVYVTDENTILSGLYLNQQQTQQISLSQLSDPIYSPTPDWMSTSPHYSTGAALIDLNKDNWLDLVVSDGNDMSQGHVRVYLNDGNGYLPSMASWESADVAYNGHLDVAVSYLGTDSSLGPIARVYLNNNGVLSSNPSWTANIIGNSFGVDFGDMNNDGRPDLAIATGWSYNSYHYHTYVYLNIDGSYGSLPSWQSSDQNIYMGVLWIDADHDGWLDLTGIGDGCQTQIYRNLGGVLETSASWYTVDSADQFGIMLTAGDVTGDGIQDLFTTDNTQLGGDGLFKQYTGLPSGFFQTTHSWQYFGGYGSAVALSDVNGDNTLDLAAGAWWENTFLFLNQGTSLPSTPTWTSAYETVVEKIVFGNIGPTNFEQTFTQYYTPAIGQRLFYLPYRQIQGIDTVTCDGVLLLPSQYTSSRDEGWVTISNIPLDSVVVTYRYSPSQDMIVTNWDSNIGNYLYYNKAIDENLSWVSGENYTGPDLECIGTLNWNNIEPGAPVIGNFTVVNCGDSQSLLSWEILSYPKWGNWSFTPSSGTGLSAGESVNVFVNVVAPPEENTRFEGNVVIVNANIAGDFCLIPVMLKTSCTSSYHYPLSQRINPFLEKIQSGFSFSSLHYCFNT